MNAEELSDQWNQKQVRRVLRAAGDYRGSDLGRERPESPQPHEVPQLHQRQPSEFPTSRTRTSGVKSQAMAILKEMGKGAAPSSSTILSRSSEAVRADLMGMTPNEDYIFN
jgi:hypothetical protein